jgi:plastocyanin
MRRILFASAFALLAACSGDDGGVTVPGNTSSGTVRGTVNDNTGAAVLGATLTLTGSGISARTANTNTLGVYVFNTVPVGAYVLSIAAPTGYTVSGLGTSTVSVTANQQSNVDPFVLNRTTTGGGGGPAPNLVDISMVNTSFQPDSVDVAIGGTVRWTNNDNTQHNATGQGAIQTPNLNPGQSSSRVMSTAGVFTYNCTIHPSMTGKIRVR